VLEQNVLNSDELKQRAHTLALENITVYHRRGSTPFRKLRKVVEQLEAYSHEFEVDEGAGFPLLPAMEWLMDHVDLFKEQNLHVEKNLSPSYYRRLPKWDVKSSKTRISVITKFSAKYGWTSEFTYAFSIHKSFSRYFYPDDGRTLVDSVVFTYKFIRRAWRSF